MKLKLVVLLAMFLVGAIVPSNAQIIIGGGPDMRFFTSETKMESPRVGFHIWGRNFVGPHLSYGVNLKYRKTKITEPIATINFQDQGLTMLDVGAEISGHIGMKRIQPIVGANFGRTIASIRSPDVGELFINAYTYLGLHAGVTYKITPLFHSEFKAHFNGYFGGAGASGEYLPVGEIQNEAIFTALNIELSVAYMLFD